MNEIQITFLGTPISKKRHAGCGETAYDPNYSVNRQLKLMAKLKMHANGSKMLPDEPIYMELRVHTNWSSKLKLSQRNGILFSSTKPDLDNYIKQYCDILNGIAYSDDRFISKICAEKIYSDKPRVEIILRTL